MSLNRYRAALAAVSERTGAPLSSLVVSFGILHEATALVPLVAVFYAARAAGLGERVVAALPPPSQQDVWPVTTMRVWVADGEAWAARVGRRYGMFGFPKGGKEESESEPRTGQIAAGAVADAVVAYAVTKALLPVRIGAALYLSPAFSRAVVDPTRRGVARVFRRGV
ncbi:hypothetical protein DFH07DRAFT_803732 [Mycena maculata]|uniref:Uncharacterized protein n=1 Tax=Mycena maculata TaxID=230809 RepID=A0AAD7NRW1_9AGAR|nr:hypothetical protein DFH07DRAFT_803732 [Mycena maculata]